MAREWQQTRFRDLVMPDAVYYQSIWAVRDLARMEERLETLKKDFDSGAIRAAGIVRESGDRTIPARPTEARVVEKAILESRVRAIRTAMNSIPPNYRDFIMDNIVRKQSRIDSPNKLWRIWKQRFLYDVAKNLSLM